MKKASLLNIGLATTLGASAFTLSTLPLVSHAETAVKTTTMYTNHGVNARTAPSVKSKVLGVIAKNTKIQVIEKTNKYWYKIVYKKDQVAYVSADYVSAKPVVVVPPVVEKGYVQHTNGVNLNVRAKASTSSNIIGSLQPGGTVYLTKKYSTLPKETWYEVVYNNQLGYVNAKYVGFDKPLPAKIVKKGKVQNTFLNVRKTASTNGKVLGTLKPHTTVKFAKQYTTTSKDPWLKIYYKDGTAYISAKYVDWVLPK